MIINIYICNIVAFKIDKLSYKLILVIAFVCSAHFSQVAAQLGNWYYQNPSPGPNGQNALEIFSEDTVYVGGWGGYSAKTYDGGLSWTDCTPPSKDGIGALEFITGLTGFTTGELGKLYKTNDGGSTWSVINLPQQDWYIGDIYFLNQQIGFIGGSTFGSNGDSTFIAKTVDGGLTWTDMPNLKRFPNSIAKIQAFSADTILVFGFASGFDGTMFTCSHDGGLSWRDVLPMPNAGSENWNQGSMYFLNGREGYLFCTTPNTILKTIDGGLTWQNGGTLNLTNGTDFFPHTLHYFNSDTAIAFASYNANAIYTTDGGDTWSNGAHTSNTVWIYSMKFAPNSQVGYANGGGGEVLKTVDGGKSWFSVQGTLRSTQFGVDFIDNRNGFTCGRNGSIYQTNDGGSNFSALATGVTSTLIGIHKVRNSQTIFACGFAGTILKSVDNGKNWDSLATGITLNLNSIYFKDEHNGIAVGDKGTVLKTINGGSNWEIVNANTDAKLNRVKMVGSQVYIASDTLLGFRGSFLKSHNGGETFNSVIIPDFPESYYGLSFVNDSTGYLCGTTGTIIKTSDYGQTWTQQLTNTIDEFFDIEFADEQRGIAVGNYGLIYETSDGGVTWQQNLGVVLVALYDLSYPDANNAWGVGGVGAIAKFSNDFNTSVSDELSQSKIKVQLYPNPSNSDFYLESKENMQRIELYNFAGSLVDVKNVNNNQIKYEAPENLTGGMYFIKVYIGGKSLVQKIILSK